MKDNEARCEDCDWIGDIADLMIDHIDPVMGGYRVCPNCGSVKTFFWPDGNPISDAPSSHHPETERLNMMDLLKRISDDFGPYIVGFLVVLACVALVAISIYNEAHAEYTGNVVRRLIVRHRYVPADPGRRECSAMPRPGGGVSIECRTVGDHPEEFWLVLEDGDYVKVGGFRGCPMQTYYAEREYCGPFYCWWVESCEGVE